RLSCSSAASAKSPPAKPGSTTSPSTGSSRRTAPRPPPSPIPNTSPASPPRNCPSSPSSPRASATRKSPPRSAPPSRLSKTISARFTKSSASPIALNSPFTASTTSWTKRSKTDKKLRPEFQFPFPLSSKPFTLIPMITRRSLMGLLAAAGSGLLSKPASALSQTPTPGSETPSGFEHPAGSAIPPGPFQGTRASLKNYEVPDWFRDAKFGMWAHWGPQSAIEDGDWYARNMYVQGSPQYNYHCQRYGHPSKFGYKDTIPLWKAEKFDPAALIKLYKKTGAKYFMSMGVHHDNFDLWNSRYQRWNSANVGPKIDIVAKWRDAARAEGLRFGVSSHLWITYKWFSTSHGSDSTGPLAGVPYDGANPAGYDLYVDSDQVWPVGPPWNESSIPVWWKQQWFKRIKDLVDHCEPDFLYSDGALPFEYYGYNLVAHLYNVSARKHGGKTEAVYFSKRPEDAEQGICVADHERSVIDTISPHPWQTD